MPEQHHMQGQSKCHRAAERNALGHDHWAEQQHGVHRPPEGDFIIAGQGVGQTGQQREGKPRDSSHPGKGRQGAQGAQELGGTTMSNQREQNCAGRQLHTWETCRVPFFLSLLLFPE